MVESPPASPVLAAVLIIVFSILALAAVDGFLAKMERAETGVEAARLFNAAKNSMDRHQYSDAIDRLNDALLIARGDREYLRTLAEAELAAGRLEGAQKTLTDVLEADSSDGLSNLLFARVLVQKGELNDGISHYHRAIYGEWTVDAARRRLDARLELVGLLARLDRKEELMAELLPLQEVVGDDGQIVPQLGRWFLQAGSPVRAAAIFREMLHKQPSDVDAHEGAGDAAFAMANYRTARSEFSTALRLAPENTSFHAKIELSERVLALDPTIRGLDAKERLRRSAVLMKAILDEVSHCVAAPDPDLKALLERGQALLKKRGASFEENLDLAEELGQNLKRQCKPATDDPLTLVLAKVAQ